MAAYGNLRPPYNATVPLLRNYPANEGFTNDSRCSVPLLQDVLIQYVTQVNADDVGVYKIVGVRVDRFYQNLTLLGNVALTSRVFFVHVYPLTGKFMSRFWTNMYSPELSETSWLNLFKAFEHVNTFEREEITFWCIFLTISLSAVVAFTKLHFTLDLTTEGKRQEKRRQKEKERERGDKKRRKEGTKRKKGRKEGTKRKKRSG